MPGFIGFRAPIGVVAQLNFNVGPGIEIVR